MSDAKVKKVTLIKMPSFTRLLIGGLAAYWLSTIMNPAFVAIAVLIILIIPVLTVDNILARQFSKAYQQPEQVVPKTITKSEYLASKGITVPVKAEEKPVEPKVKAKNAKGKK
jgi:membrane protein implicated in regulation of membrane protease activity